MKTENTTWPWTDQSASDMLYLFIFIFIIVFLDLES